MDKLTSGQVPAGFGNRRALFGFNKELEDCARAFTDQKASERSGGFAAVSNFYQQTSSRSYGGWIPKTTPEWESQSQSSSGGRIPKNDTGSGQAASGSTGRTVLAPATAAIKTREEKLATPKEERLVFFNGFHAVLIISLCIPL